MSENSGESNQGNNLRQAAKHGNQRDPPVQGGSRAQGVIPRLERRKSQQHRDSIINAPGSGSASSNEVYEIPFVVTEREIDANVTASSLPSITKTSVPPLPEVKIIKKEKAENTLNLPSMGKKE